MIGLTRGRPLLVRTILLLTLCAGETSCSYEEPPPPIRVRATDIILQNQTQAAWTGIEVWVNDHFRGVAPSLQAGQQMVVPLDILQAAYGQRFDRSRQTVFGVLVTARSADGSAVRLTWGTVRRR
jgi:hypothetical protein